MRGAAMENNDAMLGKEVRCDHCGSAFAPEVLTEMDGEIAYSFFRCDYCGKAFMVSVTDGELRQNIARYLHMAERNKVKRLNERGQRRMQRLKASNAVRSRDLRSLYLREDGHDGE